MFCDFSIFVSFRDAWKSLGDYSQQQAMREYIETIKKLDPDWSPKVCERATFVICIYGKVRYDMVTSVIL